MIRIAPKSYARLPCSDGHSSWKISSEIPQLFILFTRTDGVRDAVVSSLFIRLFNRSSTNKGIIIRNKNDRYIIFYKMKKTEPIFAVFGMLIILGGPGF